MEEERDERNDWGIFNQFPRLAMCCPLIIEILFQRRDKGNVSIKVVCRFVMLRMRNAPGMERHQKEGVDDESSSMIERLALAKSTMSAFMSQLPEASEDQPLEEEIGEPS